MARTKSNAEPLDLIKGHGGALLREKVVASASRRLIIIADESKLVDQLGTRFAVPVEVVPFGWQAAERKLQMLGAHTKLRPGPDEKPFVTDGGQLHCRLQFQSHRSPGRFGSGAEQHRRRRGTRALSRDGDAGDRCGAGWRQGFVPERSVASEVKPSRSRALASAPE